MRPWCCKPKQTKQKQTTLQVVDYSKADPSPSHFKDLETWKREVFAKTENKEIIGYHLYRSPLQVLGQCCGGSVMDCVCGKNKALHHRFLVFELQSKSNPEEKWAVSFEKDRTGIIFQIAMEFEIVTGYECGNSRGNRVEQIAAVSGNSLQGKLLETLPEFNHLFGDWQIENIEKVFDSIYRVFSSNCQTLTSDVLREIIETFVYIKLNIPGQERSVSIYSPEIMSMIEESYPKWKQEQEVALIPPVQAGFAMFVSQPVTADFSPDDMETQMNEKQKQLQSYNDEIMKQKLFNSLKQILEKLDLEGRKAIMTHLSREKLQEGSKSCIEFWQRHFDILATVENIGAIIIQFYDKNDENQLDAATKAMEDRAAMLAMIGDVPSSMNCVHTVSVGLNANASTNPKRIKLLKHEYGYHATLDLKSNEEDLNPILTQCIKSFKAKITRKDRKESTIPLRTITSRISTLQNLENEYNLIHKKLRNQYWGIVCTMLWTEEQKKIIDYINTHFEEQKKVEDTHAHFTSQNDKKTHVTVSQWQGIDDNLDWFMETRDFLYNHTEKDKVFILASVESPHLQQTLQQVIHDDDRLKEKVDVGYLLPNGINFLSYSLILVHQDVDKNHVLLQMTRDFLNENTEWEPVFIQASIDSPLQQKLKQDIDNDDGLKGRITVG